MKIASYNLNGIRSAASKGLLDYINQSDIDIFCLQETRATIDQSMEILAYLHPSYKCYFSESERKGYAGTAILTKINPKNYYTLLPSFSFEKEGRITMLEFEDFSLINCYVPNGGTRLEYKLDYLDKLNNDLKDFIKNGKELIFCADMNVAHSTLDVSKPNLAKLTTGFLDIERKKLDNTLKTGLFDMFRELNPLAQSYTWTSYRAKKFGGDLGIAYRFDYIYATKKLKESSRLCWVDTSKPYSDHYPIICEF